MVILKKLSKKVRAALISLVSLIGVVLVLCTVCLVFLLDCYKADTAAVEAFAKENDVEYVTKDNITVFETEGAECGFIFYPGAKVEHEAYIPLMKALAEKGILCALVEMPLYFPLADADAAEKVLETYPDISRWYIGGHSLGGYAASMYLEKEHEKYEGFVLLASYSGKDLSKTELDVITIYGSEDAIMNRERYEEGLALLPETFQEMVIEGGCHAYFGMYEGQDRDLAVITNKDQIKLTADLIAGLIVSE